MLIKPCMERFTEEKLTTKQEKSESGSKQIDFQDSCNRAIQDRQTGSVLLLCTVSHYDKFS